MAYVITHSQGKKLATHTHTHAHTRHMAYTAHETSVLYTRVFRWHPNPTGDLAGDFALA